VDGSGYTLDDTPTGWTAPYPLQVPGALQNVSCVNVGFCVTLGTTGEDPPGSVSFVRNSGTWSQASNPAGLNFGHWKAGHQLSCAATNYCLAIATSDVWGIASYDGLQWAMVHTFADPGWARPMRPQTVSCVLDQTCLINLKEHLDQGNAIVAWGTRT
jgi:hypothetical protein